MTMHTAEQWIKELLRYPCDTEVRIIDGSIVYSRPPILEWVDSLAVGDRVRMPESEYLDTGTVESVDSTGAFVLYHVRWDESGYSWEPLRGTGKAL